MIEGTKTLILALDGRDAEREAIASLSPHGVFWGGEEAQTLQFYDSFDWRLFEQGLMLNKMGTTVRLCRIEDGETLGEGRMRGALEGKFAWDLPGGTLRNLLVKPLSIRALLFKAEAHQHTRHLGVLNADAKTVVRVSVCRMTAEKDAIAPLSHTLVLKGVRGYDREFDAVVQRLAKIGIQAPGESVFAAAMADQNPGAYSSKPPMRLDPEASGASAARVIFQHLLDVILANEDGIRADWDTEFLHDFRVSIRRTRSALSQIKGVLPADAVAHFGDGFRNLARTTGRLRDLDVYLLEEKRYRALLPEVLAPGLDAVFSRLRTQRRRAHREMVDVLDGSAYRALIDEWAVFLDGTRTWSGEAPQADVPILTLARTYIRKRYKRVLKRGARITDETPDKDLHNLRIDCKKLRYLLEFFASLFPEDAMAQLINQLRKLQDNLGEFNDLSVQQAELRHELEVVLPRRRKGDVLISAAALGGLIAWLYARQQAVRNVYAETFAAFSHSDNRQMYRTLFGKAKGAV